MEQEFKTPVEFRTFLVDMLHEAGVTADEAAAGQQQYATLPLASAALHSTCSRALLPRQDARAAWDAAA
eukprot:COSAG04_NODE_2685_length_3740_cov_2.487229_1_plen_68_part_10